MLFGAKSEYLAVLNGLEGVGAVGKIDSLGGVQIGYQC